MHAERVYVVDIDQPIPVIAPELESEIALPSDISLPDTGAYPLEEEGPIQFRAVVYVARPRHARDRNVVIERAVTDLLTFQSAI